MHSLRELEIQSVLPLESLPNFRDLGGYPTANGAKTNKGKFYRSPSLYGICEADLDRLRKLGISCIVDLRTKGETEIEPGPLGEADNIAVYNIPLIDSIHSGKESLIHLELSELYVHLVQNKQQALREVFAAFVRHTDTGACVFHCTAGKDRTGVIAALLLMLAGVSDEDIIHNYAATAILMKDLFKARMLRMTSAGMEARSSLFTSDASNMLPFMEYIHSNYGSSEGYLRSIGLSDDEISVLKTALVG